LTLLESDESETAEELDIEELEIDELEIDELEIDELEVEEPGADDSTTDDVLDTDEALLDVLDDASLVALDELTCIELDETGWLDKGCDEELDELDTASEELVRDEALAMGDEEDCAVSPAPPQAVNPNTASVMDNFL
jgi:hypothetical protein